MIIFTPNTVIKSADLNNNFYEVTDIKSAWIDYACVPVNMTPGNSTVVSRYKLVGKTVTWTYTITFGSTSSSVDVEWAFPPPIAAKTTLNGVGAVWAIRQGTAYRFGVAALITASTIKLYSDNNPSAWRKLFPVTWAVGDIISFSITYEVA